MRQAPPRRCHSTQVRDSPALVLGPRTLTLDTRENGSLLNGRRLLKTIGVDATEKGLREVHVIEAVNDLIPVTLQDREIPTVGDTKLCPSTEPPDPVPAPELQSPHLSSLQGSQLALQGLGNHLKGRVHL